MSPTTGLQMFLVMIHLCNRERVDRGGPETEFVLYPPLPASSVQLCRTSIWTLTAQLEASRDLGEIKGRVMNKVPASRSMGFGLGHSEVAAAPALDTTILCAVSSKELLAHFPSWLATDSLKPLHGMLPGAKQRSDVCVPFIYLLEAVASLP